jgi:hypothetical protein
MFRYFPYAISAILFVGCVPTDGPEPEKTQLEIREFQTRTFEGGSFRSVMKSILDVLQDEGFMVKNASLDLGFVAATKDIGINSRPPVMPSSEFGFGFSTGRFGMNNRIPRERPAYPTHECIEATINVSEFGEQIRVRASFQSKVFDSNDAVMRVKQIASEEFYQDFFLKVDKGLFISKQDI